METEKQTVDQIADAEEVDDPVNRKKSNIYYYLIWLLVLLPMFPAVGALMWQVWQASAPQYLAEDVPVVDSASESIPVNQSLAATEPKPEAEPVTEMSPRLSPPFAVPNDIIAAAPLDCLPEVPKGLDTDKVHLYASENDVALMSELEVGKQYGDFVYEGYVCIDIRSNALNKIFAVPRLYFSGSTTITGNDVYSDYAGLEHYRVSDVDLSKLPALVVQKETIQGYTKLHYLTGLRTGEYFPNPGWEYSRLGPTTTITVDGLVYGQVGQSFQSYYGGVAPNVVAVEILKEGGESSAAGGTSEGKTQTYRDEVLGIMFEYPAAWGEITVGDEKGWCPADYSEDECNFRTLLFKDAYTAGTFLAAETRGHHNNPVGRGGFWGDLAGNISAEYVAECESTERCTIMKNNNGLSFALYAADPPPEEMGYRPERYYIFNPNNQYYGIVLSSHRLDSASSENNRLFKETVIDSFSFLE